MVPLFAQFSMYTYVRVCASKRGGRGVAFWCVKMCRKGVGLLPLFLYRVVLRFGWLLDCLVSPSDCFSLPVWLPQLCLCFYL